MTTTSNLPPSACYGMIRTLLDPKTRSETPWNVEIREGGYVILRHANRPGWSQGFLGADYSRDNSGPGGWNPIPVDLGSNAAGRTSFAVPTWVRNEVLRDVFRSELRKEFPPGTKVFLVLRHVSSSGVNRVIAPIRFYGDAETEGFHARFWGEKIAILLGWKWSEKHEGIECGGCGMDMGFHLVYSLSSALYGTPDRGGYALKHEWL